ncbi:MAG: type III pantothenate kinase [Rhodocyclales bacterium]|nr:type III pantothenate kinase [Rhodocyclales bacterium]
MKALCIDSGNTRLKWGLREGDAWREQGVGVPDETVADCIVACNVGGVPPRLTIEALAARLKVPLEWVRAQAHQCGVQNGYHHPDQLGADRWAALIGARGLHRGDCLVVMCGTATTVDLLRADGRFEGGLILPGLDLMRESLASGTADLPAAAGSYVDLPRNTFDAIASGAIQATAGAIERMARQLDPARDPLCLISGGAAGGVSPRLTFPHRVVDNLVLEGLARCATASARSIP